LKPAIEACGISTLSQSPMLGFHKQMDNRIKLLEEILSFRMQGVEFDNGDMYVDGHKARSEERRVGKECRARRWAAGSKKRAGHNGEKQAPPSPAGTERRT